MVNVRTLVWYILLSALVNLVFAFVYFVIFQFDGNSSCYPYLACFIAGNLFKYSGLIILIIVMISSLILKKENASTAVFVFILIIFGIFTLSAVLDKFSFVQKIEKSSNFCLFAPDTTKRDSCFYNRADKDKNISECDLAGSYIYECRAKINFDKCNSLTEPDRNTCFNKITK